MRGLSLAVAEGIHQFLQLRSPLDLEEDFVVVVSDFDVEVFRLLLLVRLVHRGGSVVRHGDGERGSRVER